MKYRNAKRLENGGIDCEIQHLQYGWIPFTCNLADTGALFDVGALYDAMNSDPKTAQYVYAPPAPLTPEYLSVLRADAYRAEADPIFFKWQRSEATEQVWLDKVAEIKLRYPYPEVVV
jgi:hypothetical protein